MPKCAASASTVSSRGFLYLPVLEPWRPGFFRCHDHAWCCAGVQVIKSLQTAQEAPKAPLSDLFTDVYDELPPHLVEQREELFDFVARHPDVCPADIPVK